MSLAPAGKPNALADELLVPQESQIEQSWENASFPSSLEKPVPLTAIIKTTNTVLEGRS